MRGVVHHAHLKLSVVRLKGQDGSRMEMRVNEGGGGGRGVEYGK